MTITTTSDQIWGFSILLDDRLVFRNAQIPEKFPIQLPGGNLFYIAMEPLDFFSRRRFTLSNANREPIAVLTGRLAGAALKVGDTIHRVRMRAITGLTIAIGRQSYHVQGLDIEFEIREHFLSSEVITTTNVTDDERLAIIALLHFARIHKWRED